MRNFLKKSFAREGKKSFYSTFYFIFLYLVTGNNLHSRINITGCRARLTDTEIKSCLHFEASLGAEKLSFKVGVLSR